MSTPEPRRTPNLRGAPPPPGRIVVAVATANPGKLAEITPLLRPVADLVPRPEGLAEPAEDTGSLIGNARVKAMAVAVATGLPAVADDTGFSVDALPGELGVEAAHYGGDHLGHRERCLALLAALEGVPPPRRTARFETIAMVCWPDGRELVAIGEVSGVVVSELRGEGGWGFDPVFAPAGGGGKTFAELGFEGKQAFSHRARAFKALTRLIAGPADI